MSRSWPKNRLQVVGWFVWLGIAIVGIPVAWPAAVARWLAFGLFARPYWATLSAAFVAALIVLSACLKRAAAPRPCPYKSLAPVAALGCLAHIIGWQFQTSSLSAPGVAAGYLLTTVWIGCCSAYALNVGTTRRRAKWLLLSLASLVIGVSMIHCTELDGSGRPLVCWRYDWLSNTAFASDAHRTLEPVSECRLSLRERAFFRGAKDDIDAVSERTLWRGRFCGSVGDRPQRLGLTSPTPATARQRFSAFRGEDGLGTVNGVKLVSDWSASSPRLLWRRAIGSGWGGFAVVGPCAYTQEQRGAGECVVCYEAASGLQRWIHADRTCFTSVSAGNGPRATPAVYDGRVYALGATGLLDCLDALSGEQLWSVDVLAENHAGNLYHGLSGSPLVLDDRVIVSVGGQGHSLVAYDAQTGQQVWRAGDDAAGYGSPLVCMLGGRPQIVILNRPGLAAHNPSTGEVLWQFPWTNSTETNCSQPVPVGDDRLLVSTGYGKGCALVQVRETADGWSAEPLWASRSLKTKFSSPVVRRGYAFGLDEGILSCIDLADGTRRWKAGHYGHGQMLLVEDVLLLQCEDGQVVLVAAEHDAHRELARLAALSDKTWNYPALAGRLLLVRNDREAACFELPTNDP